MLKSLFPWKHNKTKQVMAAQPPMDEELIIQEQSLLPCHVCGRTFLSNPLKKHEKVCEKNATKKRKPFDSLKQRVAGTDLADFHQKTYLRKKEEPVIEKKPRQSKWKEKHLELVTAIRAAKGVPSEKMPTSPTPKHRSTTSLITSSSQNERCPSCERHFGPKAFDRHVEWCKERRARIHQSPASVQQAKERLEARTKYRVPPLNKSKRTLVREKYSNPHSPEPGLTSSTFSTSNLSTSLSRGPSIRKPKSLVNVEKVSSEPKERVSKPDFEKSTGDRRRNGAENDRNMSLSFGAPIIGSPSPKAESIKSLQNKRNPIVSKKLNSVNVNDQNLGLIVSSISNIEVNKRMVTWKDTVNRKNISERNIEKKNDTVTLKGTVTSRIADISKISSTLKNMSIEDSKSNDNKSLRIKARVIRSPANTKLNFRNKSIMSRSLIITPDKPSINLPSKRPRESTVAGLKSNSKQENRLSSQDDITLELDKILSSNDVFSRKRDTKIPTSRGFKNISTILRRYKKAPDKDLNETTPLISPKDVSNHKDNGDLDKDNCETSKSQQVLVKGGGFKLDKPFENIKKELCYFENGTQDNSYLNAHLKGVDELDYSMDDKTTNRDDDDIEEPEDNIATTGSADLNKWFEANFGHGDGNNEDTSKTNESECINTVARENINIDECDEMTEKDSLEDSSFDNKIPDDKLDRTKTSSSKNGHKHIDTGINRHVIFEEPPKEDASLPNIDRSTKLLYLFQSGADLDLTRDNSLNALSDKKSWNSIGTTNYDKKTSHENILVKAETSNFSIKKSFSDVNILNNSLVSMIQTEDLTQPVIPLFFKRKFVYESESMDFRNTYQDIRSICSTPIMRLSRFSIKTRDCEETSLINNLCVEAGDPVVRPKPISRFKFQFSKTTDEDGKQKVVDWANIESRERLEILRIAAEKFIEEMKKKKATGMANFSSVLDVDYSVPKKKRKICVSESEASLQNNELIEMPNKYLPVAIPEPVSVNKAILEPERTLNDDHVDPDGGNCKLELKTLTVPNSAASSVVPDVTPRTVNLIQKIVQGKKIRANHSNVLLAMTVSECEKLLDLDKKCVDRVEKEMKNDAKVKLPLIVGGRNFCRKRNQQSQASGIEEVEKNFVALPKIESGKTPCQIQGNIENSENLKQQRVKESHRQSNSSNYDPFEIAQRQFMELLECDDFKPFTSSNHANHTPRPHTTVPTPLKTPTSPLPIKKTIKSAETVKKTQRASVIDPPTHFKDSLDNVTDNDDFELIENIINDHFGIGNDKESVHNMGGFYLHNVKNEKDSLTLEHILDNRKFSDDMTSSIIDPRLINENDNLSIPEHFKIDDYSPTSTVDTETTLQNDDIDHYSLQYDTKIEAIEPKATKKPLIKRSLSLISRTKRDTSLSTPKVTKVTPTNNTKKGVISNIKTSVSKTPKTNFSSENKSLAHESKPQKQEKKKGLPLLKRSMTLFEPSPKPSFKNKQEVNDFFNGNDHKTLPIGMTTSLTASVEKSFMKTSTQAPLEDLLKAEDLFSVDDEMYEEYKKYEEMYLKEKEQNVTSNKKNKNKNIDRNYGLLTNSEEEEHSNNSNNKLSNDSAYGSLRKTSKHRIRAPKLTPLEPKNVESTSSSGSENGPHSPAPPSSSAKVSKFCHECGTKFPVSTAKFCVECGVKRLVL